MIVVLDFVLFTWICFFGDFLRILPWIHHHFSPPFGRILLELFSVIEQAYPSFRWFLLLQTMEYSPQKIVFFGSGKIDMLALNFKIFTI